MEGKDSLILFGNFSILLSELVDKHRLRDPKLPNIIAYLFEIVLLLIGNASSVLFLTTLRRAKCFHPNLILLLCNFTSTFMLLSISRYIIVLPMVVSYYVGYRVDTVPWCRFGKILHDGAIYFSAFDMLILVIERIVATAYVKVYERNTCVWLSCLLLMFQYIVGIVLLKWNQDNASMKFEAATPCLREYLDKDIINALMIFVLVIDFLSIIVFMYLLRMNKRRYEENNESSRSCWLSTRFQIVENVRSTRLLLPLIIGFLIVSCLAIFLLLFLFRVIARFTYTLDGFDIIWQFCGQSFDIVVASYTIVFPWLAISSHQKLQKNSMIILRSLGKLRVTSAEVRPVEKRPQIRDLNGNSLVPINCTDETNIYFKNLTDSWNK